MNATHLDALVGDLTCAFPAADTRITQLLQAYARAHTDWRSFALFDDACYTRNRIGGDERFELLLLCWKEGQESPIHNHEGQDCWMAVLEGHIEELRYPMPTPGHVGPLDVREAHAYERGEVAFIRDEMGLHLVRPRGGSAISLHLYAAPYAECNVYCPETGRVTRKRMSDHSVRGRLVGA